MVALAVLAVLTAVAVPTFHRMLEGHQLRSAQADYIVALQHARSLAVNEQARMIFCPSHDFLHCSSDGAWNAGWLVGRADSNHPGQVMGTPRYSGDAHRAGLTIAGTGTNYVWFNPDGSASSTFKSLFFCMRDEPGRVLVIRIARLGRVKRDLPNRDDTFTCPASD
ncbi:hypothetical protein GCM10027066_34460 [Dyella jejuensis]